MSPKIYIFSLLSFCAIQSNSQDNWTRVTPTPQENTINDMTKIPGSNQIIAVAENATFMLSSDMGESWEVYTNPGGIANDCDCFDVWFTDSQTGFITTGYEKILKTTNGGLTWNIVFSGNTIYAWAGFYDLKINSDGIGFAVGYSGQMLKTTDTGDTWTSEEAIVVFDLRSLAFASNNYWVIVGDDPVTILVSDDTGSNWSTQSINPASSNGYLNDVYFINENIGFISYYNGSQSEIKRTDNAGISWFTVWNETGFFPNKFDFFDNSHGTVSCRRNGYQSGMLLTDDAGLSWEGKIDPLFSWETGNAIVMTDEDDALMAGYLGMIFQSDFGGETWEQKFSRTFWGDIFQVQFTDDQIGFAIASDHTGGVASHRLFKTVNGGLSWESIGSGETYNEASFYFTDNETGYYCMDNLSLEIYKTQNGGTDWTLMESGGFDFNPIGMNFYDENLGMICGPNDIIRTQDGGESWDLVYPGVFTDDHWDIHFKSESEILVCGSFILQTYLLRSTDGGDFWEAIIPPNYGSAYDMEFIAPNTGFMACESNMILKTTDGGLSWFATNVNAEGAMITQVRFIDEMTGYATMVGSSTNLLKTTDQGNTWEPVTTPVTAGLYDLHLFDTVTGMAFGENGTVIRTGDFLDLNPPQNLELSQAYFYPGVNVYYLNWEAPSQTNTPELAGYNIYRCGELLDYLAVEGFIPGSYNDTVDEFPTGCAEQICYTVTAIYENPLAESVQSNQECGGYLISHIGENSLVDGNITCSPNPFSANLTLTFPEIYEDALEIKIYNSFGKVVSSHFIPVGLSESNLDLSPLKAGIYFLSVQNKHAYYSNKIIKCQ